MDVFTREGLAIEVGQRLRGEHVVEVLNRWCASVGHRNTCSPTTARSLPVTWSICGPITMASGSTSPGPASPPIMRYIETFNGSLRDECLNLHWFATIAEARRIIEAWRSDYNESRPHMALGNMTPEEYALRISPSPLAQGPGAGES